MGRDPSYGLGGLESSTAYEGIRRTRAVVVIRGESGGSDDWEARGALHLGVLRPKKVGGGGGVCGRSSAYVRGSVRRRERGRGSAGAIIRGRAAGAGEGKAFDGGGVASAGTVGARSREDVMQSAMRGEQPNDAGLGVVPANQRCNTGSQRPRRDSARGARGARRRSGDSIRRPQRSSRGDRRLSSCTRLPGSAASVHYDARSRGS